MSLNDETDKDALSQMKEAMSSELERRKSTQMPEAVPEQAAVSAVSTPRPAGKEKALGSTPSKKMPLPTQQKQSEHPDKPVSAVEDTEASLRPADVKDKGAVSGGKALPSKGEQPSTPTSKVR